MTVEPTVATHPFWKHFRQTVLGEGVALGLSLLVLPIAARRFDPVGFSRYVVAFRVLALLQPTALLGLGVAVTRALASSTRSAREEATSLLVASLSAVSLVIVVTGAVAAAFSEQLGRAVFGRGDTSAVLYALVALLLGSCVFTLVSSALRGVFSMTAANVLYPLYLGVVPLAALALSRSVATVLVLIGAGWTLVSIAFARELLSHRPSRLATRTRSLLSYGLPRVPGELALFGLLSVPSILAVQADGVVAGGHVALAMSLVTMGGAVCTPLASALLPHASRAMSDADELESLATLLRKLVPLLVSGLAIATAAIAFAAPTALRIGLGSDYVSATTSIRLACLAVPGYGLYISLRSVLDAAFHRPMTMRYAVYAFGVFLVVYALIPSHDDRAVMAAFGAAVWVLAGLVTWRTLGLLERHASGVNE